MNKNIRLIILAVMAVSLWLAFMAQPWAQKSGGVLKVYFFDSPASMSIHEETTVVAERPMK